MGKRKRDGKIKEGRKESESKISTWGVQISKIVFAKINSTQMEFG